MENKNEKIKKLHNLMSSFYDEETDLEYKLISVNHSLRDSDEQLKEICKADGRSCNYWKKVIDLEEIKAYLYSEELDLKYKILSVERSLKNVERQLMEICKTNGHSYNDWIKSVDLEISKSSEKIEKSNEREFIYIKKCSVCGECRISYIEPKESIRICKTDGHSFTDWFCDLSLDTEEVYWRRICTTCEKEEVTYEKPKVLVKKIER